MITFSKIGRKGNLGNQLFQIASTIGLSVKNNQDFFFPEWKYQHYFKNKLPLLSADVSTFKEVEEKEYSYHGWDLAAGNFDILGWLQTEKYFDTPLTKHYFEFSDSLTDKIRNLYQEAFKKPTILISIRRGDFVNHPDYFQLPINYYLNSLVKFFPNWESCNLIILSDDIDYCKFHFSFLENAFFGKGLNEVEQLCLGSLCDDFIISNSTFSWWTAWLGEKNNSKIICPIKNFDGLKSLQLNDKDYYSKRWIKYNHLEDRIQLENLAIFIKSNKYRQEIKQYISSYFDVNFVFNEAEANSYESVYLLNKDCFLPPVLIFASWSKLKKLEKNEMLINSLIKTFKVSKALNYKEFLEQKDFGLFSMVFSFSEKKEKIVKHKYDFYLKNNNDSDLDKVFQTKEFLMHFSGGKFCNIGGYKYSFRKFVKNKEIQLKKSIKKMLSIK